MIEESDLDSDFPEIIRGYENKWVALADIDGKETVVGSGDDARRLRFKRKRVASWKLFCSRFHHSESAMPHRLRAMVYLKPALVSLQRDLITIEEARLL